MKDLDPDTSWGDPASVNMVEEDDGTVTCTRKRQDARHEILKDSARELRHKNASLETRLGDLEKKLDIQGTRFLTSAIQTRTRELHQKRTALEENKVVERFEAISVCLTALNDQVFDVDRKQGIVLTASEKSNLKRANIRYIKKLVFFDIDDFKEKHPPPRSNTLNNIINAVTKALSILTPQQVLLCRALEQELDVIRTTRNSLQHPKLDANAVRRNLSLIVEPVYLPTLEALLASNPKRMRKDGDSDQTDRSLLLPNGTRTEVQILEQDILSIEQEVIELHAEAAAAAAVKESEER
ncbi:hypothetical protein GGX14DRAFT_663975 [Mycena pura]|uniref:Uncharacterized protein n=1 Tax=Mycena pura TaxID=153505 RepID=A0AAD6YL14_9AGAR|nr:hypothetical protein GGX14DRAFT_663975 [Mycena pura]